MAKDLQEYTSILKKFYSERGWEDNDPHKLISSIVIELGELAEHFHGKNKFEERSSDDQDALGYEFVDVFIYLIRFAQKSNIDIEKYFDEKFPKLVEKYPVGGDKAKAHKEYRENGKNKLYRD